MKTRDQCAAEIDGLVERDLSYCRGSATGVRLRAETIYLRETVISLMIELEIANAELGVKQK